jgi:hypothetical protein
MDMQTPDFETADPTAAQPGRSLSRVSMRCLLRILSTTLPANAGDNAEIAAEKWELARELFFAMEPTNAIEAVLAARAVAAQFATMDLYARAAQPGTTDEKMLRLRGKAIAESRSFDVALRELDKRHAQAAKAAKAAADALRPGPAPAERPSGDKPSGRPGADAAAKPWQLTQASKPGEARLPAAPRTAAT